MGRNLACWIIAFSAALLSSTTRNVSVHADDLEPDVGRIVPAQALLDVQVSGRQGSTLGTTKDLVFDLQTNDVAFVLVKIDGTTSADPGYLALPPTILQYSDKRLAIREDANVTHPQLTTARRLPAMAYHMVLNRAWAEEQYKLFARQPYWVRTIKEVGNSNPPKPSERDQKYLLTLLTKLKDQQVNGQDGEAVGHIVDFAISLDDHRVAYAAVRLGDDDTKLYPLPLPAFVLTEPSKPWQIELSSDRIANTPSFSAPQWPEKIDRTWVEYVHVRYGDAVLDGVQHVSRRATDRRN